MSTETERLAREAEERRSSLDATLESLKGKLSPGQVVDELASYVRGGQGAEMVQNLNRQVRDNPLALGLIGAGAAWLLLGQGVRDNGRALARRYEDRHDNERTYPIQRYEGDNLSHWADDDRDNRFEGAVPYNASTHSRYSTADQGPGFGERARSAASGVGSSIGNAASGVGSGVSNAASSVGSGVSNAASGVGSAASGAAGAVSGAASSVAAGLSSAASSVADAASNAADRANRFSHDARDAAYGAGQAGYRGVSSAGQSAAYYGRRAQRSFLDTIQQEPLILGAVAVAIGAAIGAALPSTRVEDEWLGQTRDKLRDDAIDAGRDVAGKAQAAAESAYRAGSEEAEAKGLKPEAGSGETLAQKVSSVAHAATDAARSELGGSTSKDDATDDTKTDQKNA